MMTWNFLHFKPVLLTMALVGCRGADELPKAPPRPVTYFTLKVMNPGKTRRLTGSAESWKREEIGFEVRGRLIRVVEPGAEIVGRTFDENGKLLTEGTVLAELREQRHQIALNQVVAAAEAAKSELNTVIPLQLEQAAAALEFAQAELKRYTNLVAMDAASQQELDRVASQHRSAKARVAEVAALRITKRNQLNTFLAQVDQAKVDLGDCKLRSPFTGQIARVHTIPGGYVLPGQAVLTVQMMDPMKVNFAVSPRTDANVNHNDLVRVYTPLGDELEGYVYLKDTFADPATRTFLITLLVRNRLIEVGIPDELRARDVARCTNIWRLDKPDPGKPGNYYVEIGAIYKDDKGHFVWKVENLKGEQLYERFDPVLQVRKVRVTPSDGRVPLLQVFTFRELTDHGDLNPETDVIVGGVTGKVADGGTVVLVRKRWALRPGDVVRVGLKEKETPAGYYVPSDAIQFNGQSHYVAVAKGSGDGHKTVWVTVEPVQTVGRLQRIQSTKDELQDGMKVILNGAHYVQVGEQVNPVEEVELQP